MREIAALGCMAIGAVLNVGGFNVWAILWFTAAIALTRQRQR